MSDLNLLVGIDFSLIGTKLHAAYEDRGEEGYSVLLMPSVQDGDNVISIGKVVEDIEKLFSKSETPVDTAGMKKDLTDSLSGMSNDKNEGDKFSLDNVFVKLSMAYLYIHKEKDDSKSTLEYAFQLQIITENMIPAAVAQIVNVTNLSLSIWNTKRMNVISKMELVTIDDYINNTSANLIEA